MHKNYKTTALERTYIGFGKTQISKNAQKQQKYRFKHYVHQIWKHAN